MNKVDLLQATAYNTKPDIIGITESWTHSAISDSELYLEGYQLFRCDRKSSSKGGGVLLYVNSELNPVEFFTKTPYGEHVWCQIDNLLIGVCYRSCNTDIVGRENEVELRKVITEVSNTDFVLMGDFNYPDIDWVHNSVKPGATVDTSSFLECLDDNFVTQHVIEPTRGSAVLDLVLTRDPDQISSVDVTETLGSSDHHMVSFVIHHRHESSKNVRLTRDYLKADYSKIRTELATIDWDATLTGSAAECWSRFKEVLQDLETRYIPLRKCTGGTRRKPMWMSWKASKLVRRKQRLYAKFKNSEHPAYKAVAKESQKELKRCRKNFEKQLASNIKEDAKSFYAYAGSKNKSAKIGPLSDDNGNVTSTEQDMAHEFNQFFTTVFTKENLSTVPMIQQMYCQYGQLLDTHVDDDVVMKKLSKLRQDKAPGADNIQPRFLKEIAKEVCHALTIIFRKSLDQGEIPDDWRTANVSPIFKKGSRSKVSNYRPVSLTSQVSKIYESILRDAIMEHLVKNQLLRDSQHGFLRGRSCLSNLLTFLDKVTDCVDKGIDVDVIFLDLAKAFDKVPHTRLMNKVRAHGIQGLIGNWIENWLKGRKQRVCIRGAGSAWIDVISGVPQGSVLGPILFLIFVNDLDCGVINWLLKFADDTKLFGKVQSELDRACLQQDLQRLLDWSREWQMEFNVEKCKVMHIGGTNRNYGYHMDQKELEVVEEEKDLGVLITNDLKASQQCTAACNKANRVLGMMNRTIVYKSKEVLLNLYKSLVRPHVEYCTPVWSPCYQKDKSLIERVQHRFTRMIPGFSKLPYCERLKRLGLWSLEERRNRADLIEVFKMVKGLSGIPMESMFEFSTTKHLRGHELKLNKHRSKLEVRRHFFTERLVNRWNSLDHHTVNASTVNSFKNGLQRLKQSWMGFFED